jgi:hypothetical protein
MTRNLKVILSAVGVAAFLASPAMAKKERHHHATRSAVYHAQESPTFAPNAPAPRSYDNAGRPDFQDGSRGWAPARGVRN